MLIGSYELIQSYFANPQNFPFPQPHSFPFDVRHNLLLSKEYASSSYKAAYPFVVRMEFAAVQIIAVDSLQNSDFCKAGYIMNTGNLSKNNVSTDDLNRGRRVKPRLLFGSFCRSKKNKPVSLSGTSCQAGSLPLSGQHAARAFTPFLLETWSPCSHPFAILPVSAVSDAQKLATGNFLHVRAGSFEVCKPQISSPQRRFRTGRFAAFQTADKQCCTCEKVCFMLY